MSVVTAAADCSTPASNMNNFVGGAVYGADTTPTSSHRHQQDVISTSSTVKQDLNAAREAYFAAAVGRSPIPPRQSYIPMTPRRGIVNRQPTTGDAIIDGNNNNAQHKARAGDAVDMVLSTSGGLLNTIETTAERLKQHLNKSFEHTERFNHEFKWYTPKGLTLTDVYRSGDLKLSVEDIADKWLKRTRHAPQSVLVPILNQISGGGGAGKATIEQHQQQSQQQQQQRYQIPPRMSRVALSDAGDIFKGVDMHVETAVPLSVRSNWTQLPKPTLSEMLIAHHDFLHIDVHNQAKEELAKSNPQLERLEKQCALLQADVGIYLSQQKYADAEEKLKQLLNLEAEVIELRAHRIASLDMKNVDANEFTKEKEQLLKDTDEILFKFRRDKDQAASSISFDLRRCADLKQKMDIRMDNANDLYENNESDISARLKLNEKHHNEILSEILERAKILEKLSEDRRQMIMNTMRAREDRDREVFECSEMKDRINDYEALLNQVKNYLGDELTFCDVLDAHCGKMANHLNNRPFDDDVAEIKFDELGALKKIYSEFVSNSGNLVTKKQHRFDTVERQIRLTRLQKETAKESLDPDAERYGAALLNATDLLHDTEKLILSLESQQDAVELLVTKPLAEYEAQCREKAIPFRHPSAVTVERVVAERSAFVNRAQRYVDEEADVVAKRQLALQKAKEEVVIEQSRHKQLALSPPPPSSSHHSAAQHYGLQHSGMNSSTAAAVKTAAENDGGGTQLTYSPAPKASPQKSVQPPIPAEASPSSSSQQAPQIEDKNSGNDVPKQTHKPLEAVAKAEEVAKASVEAEEEL